MKKDLIHFVRWEQVFFGKTALAAILNNGSGTGCLPNLWNYGRGGYETTPRSNQFSVYAAEKILENTAILNGDATHDITKIHAWDVSLKRSEFMAGRR